MSTRQLALLSLPPSLSLWLEGDLQRGRQAGQDLALLGDKVSKEQEDTGKTSPSSLVLHRVCSVIRIQGNERVCLEQRVWATGPSLSGGAQPTLSQ